MRVPTRPVMCLHLRTNHASPPCPHPPVSQSPPFTHLKWEPGFINVQSRDALAGWPVLSGVLTSYEGRNRGAPAPTR